MAYQKGKGCQPITSKIKHTTKGGVTEPLLNLGSAVKMKGHSPAKIGSKGKPKSTGVTEKGFAGGTPYSVKDGKGIFHGPKVSYDMAYKNRDMKVYGGMSKAEYIKEAKRQTKSFKSTGKFDAPKATIRLYKNTYQPPKAEIEKAVTLETKKPTVAVDIKVTKKTVPTKKQTRKTKSIDKKLAKAKEARDAGNEKKALRKERAAQRKAAKLAKKKK